MEVALGYFPLQVMNSTEFVLRTLDWMWANPWSILLAFAIIAALALLARRVLPLDYYYLRGKPRCYQCLDRARTVNKVIYPSRQIAQAEATRLSRRFGQQWPYKAPCGNWHLTSQNPNLTRRRRVRR